MAEVNLRLRIRWHFSTRSAHLQLSTILIGTASTFSMKRSQTNDRRPCTPNCQKLNGRTDEIHVPKSSAKKWHPRQLHHHQQEEVGPRTQKWGPHQQLHHHQEEGGRRTRRRADEVRPTLRDGDGEGNKRQETPATTTGGGARCGDSQPRTLSTHGHTHVRRTAQRQTVGRFHGDSWAIFSALVGRAHASRPRRFGFLIFLLPSYYSFLLAYCLLLIAFCAFLFRLPFISALFPPSGAPAPRPSAQQPPPTTAHHHTTTRPPARQRQRAETRDGPGIHRPSSIISCRPAVLPCLVLKCF